MQNVVVYSLNNCPNCAAAKEMLSQKSIPYVERDLTDTDALADLMISGVIPQEAPLIQVDDNTFLDFKDFLLNLPNIFSPVQLCDQTTLDKFAH